MVVRTPTVAFVFARGGSKGVPRKNIRDLAGKPLIAYAIETALQSKLIDRVIVSTEDAEIARVAARYGAEVPFLRPAELATDQAPEILAWKHAIGALQAAGGKIGTFVSVPATAPLRSVEDIDACIRMLHSSDADLVLAITPARRHPMFHMVVLDQNSYVHIASPPPLPLHRRQDAPPVYDICPAAYAARPDFILKAESVLAGRTRAVLVPEERAIDIDTELDFLMAEILLRSAGSRIETYSGAGTIYERR